MITRTSFISLKAAEAVQRPTRSALISLTGPTGEPGPMGSRSRPARLHEVKGVSVWKAILRLEFHDAEFAQEGKNQVLFNEAMAVEVLRFLKRHEGAVDGAVVHCEGGISRSAAVSKFIARIYNLSFPESYEHYNSRVFEVLLQVYGRCLSGKGPIEPQELPGVLDADEFIKLKEQHPHD